MQSSGTFVATPSSRSPSQTAIEISLGVRAPFVAIPHASGHPCRSRLYGIRVLGCPYLPRACGGTLLAQQSRPRRPSALMPRVLRLTADWLRKYHELSRN